MNLTEFEKVLTEYRGNFTPQSWKRFDYKYENEYLKIIGIDCSNVPGGESLDSGKQWGIIFEKNEKDFTQLKKWNDLISKINDIKITPRRGYDKQYGIRFYNMSKCPDENIINAFIEYLFHL